MRGVGPQQDEGFRLLDERGCLTFGAMALVEQLDEDRRAVVTRHLKGCPICVQQHTSMALATAWIRRGGPRVAVPVEARLAARQVILRGLRAASRARPAKPVRPGLSSPLRWVVHSPALAGAIIAAVAAAAGLLMARLFG